MKLHERGEKEYERGETRGITLFALEREREREKWKNNKGRKKERREKHKRNGKEGKEGEAERHLMLMEEAEWQFSSVYVRERR